MKIRLLAALALVMTAFGAMAQSEADALWQELSKAAKPPTPPAEWSQKRPTGEERLEWQKTTLSKLSEEVAAKAKKFHETYPEHPKAAEARSMETKFTAQAATFKNAGSAPPQSPAAPAANPASPFQKAFAQALEKVRARRIDGPMGVADELEKQGRALAKEFPKEEQAWELLLGAASYSPTARAASLYKEIAANAPAGKVKDRASGQARKFEAVGKPFQLAFDSIEGQRVDIADYKGKVVLVDFWATWCGPCVMELPRVIATYNKLHGQGFEIIGVSLDHEAPRLKRFVATNKMPWPQYFDGQGFESPMAIKNGINAIPSMFLVDKNGILRDMNAGEDLENKIRGLLAE